MDARNRILKDLINSFHFLEQFKKFHMQCIESEEKDLQRSIENWESTHRTFERLENIEDLQDLWNEYQRQQMSTKTTIQTFLKLNPDLKDTKYFLEATKLLENQKALECPNTDEMKDQPSLKAGNLLLATAGRKVENVDPQKSELKLPKAN